MRKHCLLCFAFLSIAAGQAFEVASVKPSAPASQRGASHFNIDVGRVDIASFPLGSLIAYAYGVNAGLVDGPVWLNDRKFDIQAKPPDGATRAQIAEMLKALLIERFGLAVHRETRHRNIYALIIGKDGLKTKELPADTPKSMRPVRLPNNMIRMDVTDTFAALATYLSPYVELERPVVDLSRRVGHAER